MQTNMVQAVNYIPYSEIGNGSQFRAFDMHDGRVLKMPLTKEETRTKIMSRRHNQNPLSPNEPADLDARVQTLINGKARIPEMLNHPFLDREAFRELFGNPVIIEDDLLPEDTPEKQWGSGRIIYTQDKVATVGEIFNRLNKKASLSQDEIAYLQQIIDMYAKLMHAVWEFGYSDYVFKIGDTGFDGTNKLVQIDLGEYTKDPQFMIRVLREKRWLHATISAKKDFPQVPAALVSYYTDTLNTAFSEEEFWKHWGKRHSCTICQKDKPDVLRNFIQARAAEIDLLDRW